jgi:hypothetical protein
MMGVSIKMRPGTIMRSKGEPISITPGLRSRAAELLRVNFGSSPMEIDQDSEPLLETLSAGASIYTGEDNMWQKILTAVQEHNCVVVSLEY